MGRWKWALLVALCACVPVWTTRASSPGLLQDSDTAVMLRALQERADPWSWFRTDWPLENHFYRPVSTLTFEWDLARGGGAGAFGATNALLAIGGILALFWLLREMADSPWMAGLGAVLFASWLVGFGQGLEQVAWVVAASALALAVLPGRRLAAAGVAAGAWVFAGAEWIPIAPLHFRMLDWIPGRTASVMGLFALVSMAAYARYERCGTAAARPAPGPLDPPATKSSVSAVAASRWNVAWIGVSLAALALALGSYEQAVMVPAALLGIAVSFRLEGRRVRWGWHLLFWAALVGYLLLRASVVPSDPSGYQQQQFRTGPGVGLSLLDYLLPAAGIVWTSSGLLEQGAYLLLSAGFWAVLLSVASTVAIVWALRRRWRLTLAGWALSSLAFLPMAWMKSFEHYHYWPMALRTLFVAAVVGAAANSWISAASRPTLQAPSRPDPAPGSLPRP
ncbi:MAG: hypothetical protein H6534_10140 [Chthonomonadaceae bacterium]|nr:hypothetical protein [Chthonomonadaceae bacterium]